MVILLLLLFVFWLTVLISYVLGLRTEDNLYAPKIEHFKYLFNKHIWKVKEKKSTPAASIMGFVYLGEKLCLEEKSRTGEDSVLSLNSLSLTLERNYISGKVST